MRRGPGPLHVALIVLLSYWRKNPIQLFALIIGLSMATAIWSGVQAINSEARASYERAEATLKAQGVATITAKFGAQMLVADFAALQRTGWRTTPIVQGRLRVGNTRITILGIDPLTSTLAVRAIGEKTPANSPDTNISDLQLMLSPAGLAYASPETMAKLSDSSPGNEIRLPVLKSAPNLGFGILVTDISLASRLLNTGDTISRLRVLKAPEKPTLELQRTAPHLAYNAPTNDTDAGRLTDSFHLNLTAFGFLSFAVGLFIVHGTIGLAFEQRRSVFRTLRALGLSLTSLTAALVIELTTLALLAGALGVLFGYVIASALLPDVAATLRGLYGAQIEGSVSLRAQWWCSGLAIVFIGTAVASASSLLKLRNLPILATAHPRAWTMRSINERQIQICAAVVLLVLAAALGLWGTGLVAAFILLGSLLIGFALVLPTIFSGALQLAEVLAANPVAQWFWADTRQQVPGLSLALMALLLALAANIGVGTMVGSFRSTFTGWLDQRLASELYVTAEYEEQARDMRRWLNGKADAVLPIWNVDTEILGLKGQIYGVANHATYRNNWPLLNAIPGVWDRIADGKALLINEQLARRKSLSVGDMLSLAPNNSLPIAGVYSDYGNTSAQIMISSTLLVQLFPQVSKRRYGVRIAPDKAEDLALELKQKFELGDMNVIQQDVIKRESLRIFERTFSVTSALNVLTLAVAGFAIFTSLLTLSSMRIPQLAPVWALGFTRKRLARLELLRALVLAGFTFLFALPVGLLLAWVLLSVVNVEAFGWLLPMELFPLDWSRMAALALVAVCLAAIIPARKLARIPPAELMKVFTHER
ncbi:MAG: ABC transporter permease [Pseudomonadota bacterium]